MAFKYYEKYLDPEGAPEMPEDKRGEEVIEKITNEQQQGKCDFINLCVLTLVLVFCAMIVFVLRANDYTSLNESEKLDKDNFLSGEFFGGLESDVVGHLALSDQIVRTDNFLHYFCGIGNELMEREEEQEEIGTSAFRASESPVPGGRNNIDGVTHEVVTRTTTVSTEAETKKTKKTKKTTKAETSVTTAVKKMTSTEPDETTTTTTTTTEASTTTKATNNTAPAVTTKVTTAPTQAPATKPEPAKTTSDTTAAVTEPSSETQQQPTETDPPEQPAETDAPEPEQGQA
ncbi:MAG: hypothetical protein IJM75_03570 [Ruminococcus sp.]|nr:hypothetical protein [Ruminococcus sp.]